MSIDVNLTQDLAGYLEEGDLIDIIARISASSDSPEKIKTNDKKVKTINGDITFVTLSAVKVLKLGDITNKGGGKVNTVITLLLTPKECVTLHNILCQTKPDSFTITLRQKTDDSKVDMKPYSNQELIK